jgi:hypothetical protein
LPTTSTQFSDGLTLRLTPSVEQRDQLVYDAYRDHPRGGGPAEELSDVQQSRQRVGSALRFAAGSPSRDRKFESISLQRRVESQPCAKMALAGRLAIWCQATGSDGIR